jgi:hypothetical protein
MATEKIVPTDRELQNMEMNNPDVLELTRQAEASDAADRLLTVRQALMKYKKAVFWAMFLSTSLIMEGYDLVIVSILLIISEVSSNIYTRSRRSMVSHSLFTDLELRIQLRESNLSQPLGNLAFPTHRSLVNLLDYW